MDAARYRLGTVQSLLQALEGRRGHVFYSGIGAHGLVDLPLPLQFAAAARTGAKVRIDSLPLAVAHAFVDVPGNDCRDLAMIECIFDGPVHVHSGPAGDWDGPPPSAGR